jgi:uncharacterized membrane protein YedE/YeeE
MAGDATNGDAGLWQAVTTLSAVNDALATRPAWYVIGLLVGLVTVGLLAAINERVGVLGGYSAIVERATGRAQTLSWKAWFLFGVLGGAFLFRLLAGSSVVPDGYGWLTREFGAHAYLPVGALLLVSGVLTGFGAKAAGGCTSGNGIGGTSLASPASFVATGTFMATAIVASFVIKGLT